MMAKQMTLELIWSQVGLELSDQEEVKRSSALR